MDFLCISMECNSDFVCQSLRSYYRVLYFDVAVCFANSYKVLIYLVVCVFGGLHSPKDTLFFLNVYKDAILLDY